MPAAVASATCEIVTATGDDGATGTAYLYDVRYLANEPITVGNWDLGAQAQGEPLPQPKPSA